MNDLKFAFRQLVKNPGFTTVAALTLALGIGANTAIFSVVDRALIRPMPVACPQQLVVLGQREENGRVNYYFSYPLFRDYLRQNAVLSHLTATTGLSVGLGTGAATDRHQALLVSGNYFSMLGIDAALGRTFSANEGVTVDDAPVIVISHGLWQRRFGADPSVIGRPVTVNGQPLTLVGVAPRGFTGTTCGAAPDLYVPLTMYGQLTAGHPGNDRPFTARDSTWLNLMGRVKDGVTSVDARGALGQLAQQLHAATPLNTSTDLVVFSGAQGFVFGLNDSTRLAFNLLLGATFLVLLIACANLANLQMARATVRAREFAIRLALGASRGRLARQLFSESLLLALGGGLLGLFVAVWLEKVLWQFHPASLSIEIGAGLDLRVLTFAFGVSALTGILFGLVPALRSGRPQLVSGLKGGGETNTRVSHWNLRNAFVVLQIALSLLVLVNAGLCVRSLQKLQNLDPGFEPSRVVLASFDMGLIYHSPPRVKEFYDHLLERVRTLPSVKAASLSANTPLTGGGWRTSVGRIEGYQPAPDEDDHLIANVVTDDYFRALGVPLLSGRDFGPTDSADGAQTMIVNDAFAQCYWPGQNAVGKQVYRGGPNGDLPVEVIGVVATTPYGSLSDAPEPVMYFPLAQEPQPALTLLLRTGAEPSATVAQLRGLVKSLDANAAVFDVRTLAQKKDGSLALQQMAATLLTGFGLLALLLAALGIYGVLAYAASRRTREIGVRMALGAQIGNVLVLVMRRGIGLLAVGIALGLGGAFAATRLLRSFLFEVQPLDPPTFVIVTVVLAVVALLACWLPAHRAAKVDPMEALRSE